MDVLAATNAADFGIALVGAVSAVATVMVQNHKQNKKLDKVERSVSTTNGKTSGEYIEDIWHRFPRLERGQELLQKQFAEHTVDDKARFAVIDARLDRISEDLTRGNDS